MDDIKLIFPTIKYKESALLYIKDHFDNGEFAVHGDGGLDIATSYEEWLDKISFDLDLETTEDVPTTTFFAVRECDDKVVGTLRVRHVLDDYFSTYGGHIGYGVSPKERKKGYATKMLKDALEFCKTLNIKDVLITCNKSNIASAKTILKCGGILEDEIDKDDGKVFQRYWIHIV